MFTLRSVENRSQNFNMYVLVMSGCKEVTERICSLHHLDFTKHLYAYRRICGFLTTHACLSEEVKGPTVHQELDPYSDFCDRFRLEMSPCEHEVHVCYVLVMSMHYTSYWKGLSQILMGTTKEEVESADVSSTYQTSCPIGGREIMKQKPNDYQVVPYPKLRRFTATAYRSVQHKPMMHGLLEVDVTRARAFMRDQKAKTGESLSFTAFVIACLGKAVDEYKSVQAIRLGSKRLILFEEVDVYTLIERDVAGQKQFISHIIRAANRKTFRAIHHEIRTAQEEDVAKALEGMGIKAFLILPIFLSRFLMMWLPRYPQLMKKYRGTVEVTAVGMFGKGAGWGIPPATPTLTITVGGIGKKPGVVDGQIAIRDYLSLTISFDHNMIDGAPAARFIERLKELIESGYGLSDSTVESELAGAEAAAQKS